jgi:hypothetical protein
VNGNGFLAIDVCSANFSFGSGTHDVAHGAGNGEERTIGRGRGGGGFERGLREITEEVVPTGTGRALANFEVYVTLVDNVKELVIGDDFVWDQGNREEFHVLKACHGGPVIEILDVEDHEFCIGGAIKQAFGGGEAGTLCGGDAGVDEVVATHSDLDSVGLFHTSLCAPVGHGDGR